MSGTDPFPASGGLLILRHAQSTWNAAGRWQGWADPPLSPTGEAQVSIATAVFRQEGVAPFEATFSSDLQRARRTAQLLSRALDSPEPVARPELREHNVGHWSGLTRPEIEAGWPGQIGQWSRGELASTPGGESRPDFESRIHRVILDIARSQIGKRVLVISHGGAIRALTRVIAVEQSQVGSLSGCWVAFEDDQLRLLGEFDPLAQRSNPPELPVLAPEPAAE